MKDKVKTSLPPYVLDTLAKLVEMGGISTLDLLVSSAYREEYGKTTIQLIDAIQQALLKHGLARESRPGEWVITPHGREIFEERFGEAGIDREVVESAVEEEAKTLPTTPYDSTQVKVDFAAYPVFQVLRKIKLKEIALDPDFQRLLVWDDIRQSRLIESMLIRIPLPAFYLDAEKDDRWLVVDGLQRLSTLDRFCNQNAFKLRGLEFLPELNGKTYKDLPRKYQIQIEDNTRLTFYILQPGTPANVKFTVFYRINTGGVVLSSQEIRHALFQGPATKLLKVLASSDSFLQATTGSINTKRMDDRECILRFLAFRQRDYKNYLVSDLDGFLSDAMAAINAMPAIEVDALIGAFNDAMLKANEVFGRFAFRKIYSLDGRRSAISKTLFEVWSVELARHPASRLAQRREAIITSYIEVMNTDFEFGKSISYGTGNVGAVHKRFGTIRNLLEKVLA
jgi:hypothetical protein